MGHFVGKLSPTEIVRKIYEAKSSARYYLRDSIDLLYPISVVK